MVWELSLLLLTLKFMCNICTLTHHQVTKTSASNCLIWKENPVDEYIFVLLRQKAKYNEWGVLTWSTLQLAPGFQLHHLNQSSEQCVIFNHVQSRGLAAAIGCSSSDSLWITETVNIKYWNRITVIFSEATQTASSVLLLNLKKKLSSAALQW